MAKVQINDVDYLKWKMNKSENIYIPLVIGAVLVLTAFVPVLQIIMLYGNGAILYTFETIFNTSDIYLLNFINLLFGIIFLIAFYYAKKIGFKILWAIVSIFFFNGFIYFIEMGFTKGGDSDPYFLGFLVSGIITTIPLLITGILKEKNINGKTSKPKQ